MMSDASGDGSEDFEDDDDLRNDRIIDLELLRGDWLNDSDDDNDDDAFRPEFCKY